MGRLESLGAGRGGGNGGKEGEEREKNNNDHTGFCLEIQGSLSPIWRRLQYRGTGGTATMKIAK